MIKRCQRCDPAKSVCDGAHGQQPAFSKPRLPPVSSESGCSGCLLVLVRLGLLAPCVVQQPAQTLQGCFAILQHLLRQPEPLPIIRRGADRRCTPAAKHEQAARERSACRFLLTQLRQRVDALILVQVEAVDRAYRKNTDDRMQPECGL